MVKRNWRFYRERVKEMVKSLSKTPDIHLTNVAVQKTAPDYDPEKGSKWSVQQLRKFLVAKHGQIAVSKECKFEIFQFLLFPLMKFEHYDFLENVYSSRTN